MQVGDAKDMDVVRIYNLIKHNCNYSKTTEILWQHFRDDLKTAITNSDHANYSMSNRKKRLMMVKQNMLK